MTGLPTGPEAVATRNAWIDVLRGAAAVSVALFHFVCWPLEGTPGPLSQAWIAVARHGHYGVPVFFVLSGYCITVSWLGARTWGTFLQRRLARILPPYYLSLLLVVAIAAGAKLVSGVNDVAPLPQTLSAALATLALATYPISPVPTANWVYWSLSYELVFYSMVAMLLLFPPGRARLAALAGLHLVCCGAALAELAPHPGPLSPIGQWPLFGLGAALAVWRSERRFGVMMLSTSLLHYVGALAWQSDWLHWSCGLLTTAAIAASSHAALPRGFAMLRRAGELSYSLYLVHVPVGVYVLLRPLVPAFPADLVYLGAQGLALLASVSVAYAFFRLAERPFLRRPVR